MPPLPRSPYPTQRSWLQFPEKKRKDLFRGHGADDVRVPGISNAQAADSEVLSACSTQVDVVATVMVHPGLGKHGVVLDLWLAKRWTVVGDDNELALATAQRLERGAIAQRVLTGFHHQRQPVVDALLRLLGLLHGHHGCYLQRPTMELPDRSACAIRASRTKLRKTQLARFFAKETLARFRVLPFEVPIQGLSISGPRTLGARGRVGRIRFYLILSSMLKKSQMEENFCVFCKWDKLKDDPINFFVIWRDLIETHWSSTFTGELGSIKGISGWCVVCMGYVMKTRSMVAHDKINGWWEGQGLIGHDELGDMGCLMLMKA